MTKDLTEQWKNGKLPSGWYYYKTSILGNIAIADSSTIRKYRNRLDWKDIITILAPVPSYDLFVELTEKDKENAKLKELLKECRKALNKAKGDTVWYPVEIDHVLTKIDEVLK